MALQSMDPRGVERGLRRWRKAMDEPRRDARARRLYLYMMGLAALATGLAALVHQAGGI